MGDGSRRRERSCTIIWMIGGMNGVEPAFEQAVERESSVEDSQAWNWRLWS